eukprot:15446506-Alexandrium_andersonii.AAC.1
MMFMCWPFFWSYETHSNPSARIADEMDSTPEKYSSAVVGACCNIKPASPSSATSWTATNGTPSASM